MAVNQLKAGATLNYILILVNTLVGLIYTPFMLHMIGQSEYGLYALVASVIAYLTVLDLGLGNAIVRYTSKLRAEGKTAEQYELFGMFFVLYLIIGLLAVIGGAALYFNVDNMFGDTMSAVELHRARIMMIILTVNLAVTFPMSIFGSIMTAYERFVFPKVLSLIETVLNTAVMILLLKLGYKAIAMVVVHTVFNMLTLCINYLYCKFELKIKLVFKKFDSRLLKEIAIYSFWIFLNVIMDRIYWGTGQFVLGAVAGTVAVSVFAIAIQLQGFYMGFSTSIASVFLPRVTGMVTRNTCDKEISDLFIKTGRIQFIVMGFILSGFIVFGKQFIMLWAGPEYEQSYAIAVLFFVALLVPLIQNLGITILQARNQLKFRSILYVVIALVALGMQIVLAKKFEGIGCAVAISGALLLGHGLIMNIYYQVKQKLDILEFWKEIIRMAIVPAIVSTASMFVLQRFQIDSWGSFLVGIICFGAVYLPLFWFFSMNDFERNLFVGPMKGVLNKFIRK